MRATHKLIIFIGILGLFGIFYLTYIGEINMDKTRMLLTYLIGGCKNDNSKCDFLEICNNTTNKCIDPCFKKKCGLHEWCQKLYHESLCVCLPGFIRNSTTNICDIKGCRTNEDCGPAGECDIYSSECFCDSDFLWDSISKSCIKIILQKKK